MGLQIGEIIPKKEISFSQLNGKVIAVDAFNAIYQFLTTIRQPDGTPLKDSKGNVTSHLSGLFYRNMNLLLEGMKLIYVFDGMTPKMKEKTHEKRREIRELMQEKYKQAVKDGDVLEMGKYSRRDVSLDERKITESKELLEAMGIAVVQAPGEGEAQASYLTKVGKADAVSSQDYDCLLFEAPLLIQNLSLARKRKTISGFREVFPQIIALQEVLQTLEINQEQLLCLGIISGTDYNPGGIKGLGPKKSLAIVREYKTKENIFHALAEEDKFAKYELNFDWKKVYEAIKHPALDTRVKIEFPKINTKKIKEILLQYEFSEERIDTQLAKFSLIQKQASQRKLF
jgi:flap endonuclease-1